MFIRKEQLDVLQNVPEDAFVEELAEFARTNQSVWVKHWSDDELRDRIRNGISRARSHGFEWQSSLAKFVMLMIRFAPNFDQYPAVYELLERSDVSSESRADLLFTEIAPEEWANIQEGYEPLAWTDFDQDEL